MFSPIFCPSFLPDQAAGIRLGTITQNFACMATSVILSFFYGWELTMLIIAVMPIIAIAVTLEMRLLAGQAADDKRELEMAGKVEMFLFH